jgi:hypothetical protein
MIYSLLGCDATYFGRPEAKLGESAHLSARQKKFLYPEKGVSSITIAHTIPNYTVK